MRPLPYMPRMVSLVLRGRNAALRLIIDQLVAELPANVAERRFGNALHVYLEKVWCGAEPGPYTAEMAERFARALLIPESALHRVRCNRCLALQLRVPVKQVAIARRELREADAEPG